MHYALHMLQNYVIKFVSDLRQVSGFLRGTPVSSTNKSDHHNIDEILLKVVLNTITPYPYFIYICQNGQFPFILSEISLYNA